jgi:hypothetical protein
VAPEEIGGRWEQFNDCFLPVTAKKWCPIRRVMFHKKVPEKEAYLGNFLIPRNSFLGRIMSEVLYLLTF